MVVFYSHFSPAITYKTTRQCTVNINFIMRTLSICIMNYKSISHIKSKTLTGHDVTPYMALTPLLTIINMAMSMVDIVTEQSVMIVFAYFIL